MARLFKLATAGVVFCFLFTAVAYACSGRELPVGAKRLSAHAGMAGDDPCADAKLDVCQSIRDRILSIRPSTSEAAAVQIAFTNAVQAPPATGLGVDLFHATSPPWRSVFHPVFKLQLPVSYLVLRL